MIRFSEAAQQISSRCHANEVRKAARALSKIYDGELKPTGLLVSQLTVLAAVARFGERGAPMGKIARILVLDATTMTRNLRPLEVDGLLRVARSPEDARVRCVFLTRAGERKIEEAFPLWRRAQAKVGKRFGERRADTVRAELSRIVELLRERE
jgi:DNA-binding MarR family transcriptional regulator